MYEESKELKGLSNHEILRQRRINDYYKNPNHCESCGDVIKVSKKRKVSETRRKRFCSKSCAASFNNKGVRRHGNLEGYTCPHCGNKKTKSAKVCHECKVQMSYVRHKMTSLKEIANEGNARVRWSRVRTWAKKILNFTGREFKCELCNESCVLDVCHIKAISSFPETALCGEVNHLDNLIYLCPTHHVYFDKGWVTLDGGYTKECPCE